MKAKDVMTAGVVTIAPDASVLEAIRLMLQRRISGLPVVDASGTLVGMVTEGDFLRRSELGTERKAPRWIEFLTGPGAGAEQYVHAHGRKVRDVMTSELYIVDEETSLSKVVDTMERRGIKRVPVLRAGKLVGIVTRTNLLHALAGQQHVEVSTSSDITIRTKLMAELQKRNWAPLVAIDIAVTNGVVRFSGTILDDRQRQALRVAAENISGVKGIEDHLVWVEPTSGMVIGPAAVH